MVTTAREAGERWSTQRSGQEGGGHRDDGHKEEILQADSDTKKEKVTNKHHQRIRTRRYKYWIIGMDECKRCGDHTSWWGSGELHDAQVCTSVMTKNQRFNEEQVVDKQLQEGDAWSWWCHWPAHHVRSCEGWNDRVFVVNQLRKGLHRQSQEQWRPAAAIIRQDSITWNSREGHGSDWFEKYEQHAGRERVVRLIEDIPADPRGHSGWHCSDGAKHRRRLQQACVQANDPYRAKRMRWTLKALSSREGLTASSHPGRHGQLKGGVVHCSLHTSRTRWRTPLQWCRDRFATVRPFRGSWGSPGSAHRDQGVSHIEYIWRDDAEMRKCCAGSKQHRLAVKPYSKDTSSSEQCWWREGQTSRSQMIVPAGVDKYFPNGVWSTRGDVHNVVDKRYSVSQRRVDMSETWSWNGVKVSGDLHLDQGMMIAKWVRQKIRSNAPKQRRLTWWIGKRFLVQGSCAIQESDWEVWQRVRTEELVVMTLSRCWMTRVSNWSRQRCEAEPWRDLGTTGEWSKHDESTWYPRLSVGRTWTWLKSDRARDSTGPVRASRLSTCQWKCSVRSRWCPANRSRENDYDSVTTNLTRSQCWSEVTMNVKVTGVLVRTRWMSTSDDPRVSQLVTRPGQRGVWGCKH